MRLVSDGEESVLAGFIQHKQARGKGIIVLAACLSRVCLPQRRHGIRRWCLESIESRSQRMKGPLSLHFWLVFIIG